MVYVVLRNGKVLQYNTGAQIDTESGCLVVCNNQGQYLAKLPLDVVERGELHHPCRVMKEQSIKQKDRY